MQTWHQQQLHLFSTWWKWENLYPFFTHTHTHKPTMSNIFNKWKKTTKARKMYTKDNKINVECTLHSFFTISSNLNLSKKKNVGNLKDLYWHSATKKINLKYLPIQMCSCVWIERTSFMFFFLLLCSTFIVFGDDNGAHPCLRKISINF
jgi:hypothetical protein